MPLPHCHESPVPALRMAIDTTLRPDAGSDARIGAQRERLDRILPVERARSRKSILLATDAWAPQVNGVVRAYEMMRDLAPDFGYDFKILSPADFRTIPMPGYSEIALALADQHTVARFIETVQPAHIHIATEGPIGWSVRRYCDLHGLAYTTGYHTRFPEYAAARMIAPKSVGYALQRLFHRASRSIMVPSPSIARILRNKGFRRVSIWSRGIDFSRFPGEQGNLVRLRSNRLTAPRMLFVGRVAVEKNLPAFLSLDVPGTKIVVGDGPAREQLQAEYPDVEFRGVLRGAALSAAYCDADVFVFPSKTDTLGNVMLEAMACGTPVAAFPVTGPIDVVSDGFNGSLKPDLRLAIENALQLDRKQVAESVRHITWDGSASVFFGQLVESGFK